MHLCLYLHITILCYYFGIAFSTNLHLFLEILPFYYYLITLVVNAPQNSAVIGI